MQILHLTVKKKWFDMISSGEKTEEYREMKPYWRRRLDDLGTEYDAVKFRNGYRHDAPTVTVKLEGVFVGVGRKEWGAPNERVYILRLGEIYGASNKQAH
ncbi:MAG TPA: ASCH domain-containing protein [Gammaproteobacteria bacterium]|nr:ASCH domain-containing protein [Gammaproteobacteria bacterium]